MLFICDELFEPDEDGFGFPPPEGFFPPEGLVNVSSFAAGFLVGLSVNDTAPGQGLVLPIGDLVITTPAVPPFEDAVGFLVGMPVNDVDPGQAKAMGDLVITAPAPAPTLPMGDLVIGLALSSGEPVGPSVLPSVGDGVGGSLSSRHSGLHIANSLQYASPKPQKPYALRQYSPGQGSPSHGPMVGWGVEGEYVGSAEVGCCVGAAIGDFDGSPVAGARVGDRDGSDVVGLKVSTSSDGGGVGL